MTGLLVTKGANLDVGPLDGLGGELRLYRVVLGVSFLVEESWTYFRVTR